MAVPDYQSVMLPLLKFSEERKAEISTDDAVEALATRLGLTDDDLKEMLPSGLQRTFVNRVGWAATYMKKAGLLAPTRRGYYRITPQGQELLQKKPTTINVKLLKQYPEFLEFQQLKGTRRGEKMNVSRESLDISTATPSEALETAYENLRDELVDELLVKLKKSSPSFFERIVVELLVKMGYGGSRADAGKAIGKSGDGGIDGIIKEDRLGLDIIYIQAKRWENTVTRPEIQKFVAALQGKRARKGIFITTSDFSQNAHEYVSAIENKIILIDGQQLSQLMIDFGVGVATDAIYELKRLDSDYFTEN